MVKKVIAITTGGTIAMKYDKAAGGLIPAVSGEDLLEAVPPLKDMVQIEVVEYSNVPSGHITPRMMLELAKLIDIKKQSIRYTLIRNMKPLFPLLSHL